jgi:hypothetical protein
MLGIRRREFIAVLGGAAVWPLAARATRGSELASRVVERPGVIRGNTQDAPAHVDGI